RERCFYRTCRAGPQDEAGLLGLFCGLEAFLVDGGERMGKGGGELEGVVDGGGGEAHVGVEAVRGEEGGDLKEHALKKPMGVLDIWALGVGVVITGAYFGWNQGLQEAGPIGMLLASLFVCGLYMAWVLALSELSVAMPFAGGPLAYGRRAVGP